MKFHESSCARRTLQTLLVGLALLVPTALLAQEDGAAGARRNAPALEEIVVTAQRREQTLQDVPMAVSTLTDAQIQRHGILRPNDLAIVVPNLNVTAPHAEGAPNFSMRGVSVGNEFNYNQASPIGVYVDEVYLGARFMHGSGLFDVERVEVLRGPQGTLYGRNTTGGAINFITKRPTLEEPFSGYVTLGLGNRSRIAVEAGLEATISDQLGVRYAGRFIRSDDFMRNVYPGGEDGQGTDAMSHRLTFLFRPTEDLDVVLRGYIMDEEPGGSGVIAIGSGLDGRNLLTGSCRCDAGGRGSLSDREFSSNRTDDIDIESKGVNLTVNFRFAEGWEFTSVTSWDDGHIAQPRFDWTASPIAIGNGDWLAENEQAQQDLRVHYTGERFDFIAGAYYGWDQTDVNNDYHFYEEIAPVDVLLAQSVTPTTVHQSYEQIRKSLAFYAHGTYAVTDRLSLTAGLRWTKDRFSYENGTAWLEVTFPTNVFQVATGTVIPLAAHPILGGTLGPVAGLTLPQQTIPGPGPLGVPADLSNPLPTQRGASDQFTGTFILDYQVTEDVMAYGSYSKGYRAGAFNGNGYLDPSQISFVEPEKVDAFEIGIKSRFLDDRVQLNAAGFFYDYENNQFQNIIGIVSFLENAGGAEVRGFELELAALLTENIRVNLNVGWQDTEFQELVLESAQASDGRLNGDTNGNGFIDPFLGEVMTPLPIDLAGNQMMNTPEWNATIAVDWSVWENDNGTLMVQSTANWIDHQYFSVFNDLAGNGRLEQDAYWLVNAQLVWEAERYTARLWARNVFDKTYKVYGIDIRSGFDVDYFMRGAPSSYGVDVTIRF